ncbi:MAG: glutamate--tRNA ligase [Planctomycetota bacterium]|jgi:glutamyl-tRNA synthetase
MATEPVIRTRFAPSPSGHLHVGGARTALFCWAYAKGRGGTFILRIEDTDRKRSSDAASVGFLEDLRWLGLDWDEGPELDQCGGGSHGPYFSSERLHHYHEHAQRLIDAGLAYRAFETPEELEASREEARRAGRPWRYDRAALRLDPGQARRHLEEGRPHVVRFRVPDDATVTVEDAVLGTVTTSTEELDDFVIVKTDGYPTYHFAVVVDDELMEVTHVIRGQEHLNNTARHVLLQDALGFRRPVFAHLSLIFNPDGSKMSKRDKDKALRRAVEAAGATTPPPGPDGDPSVSEEHWLWWRGDPDHQLDLDAAVALAGALDVRVPEINVDDFRRAGYLPEVLVNYLALLGWSPGGDVEKFDRGFLLERFDLDRIIKSPAKFDRDKLLAFNLDALQAMPPDEFRERFRGHCRRYHPEFVERLDPVRFALLATANQGRSKTLDDTIESIRFFILDDDAIAWEATKAVRKALAKGDPSGAEHLAAVTGRLEMLDPWSVEAIERCLDEYAAGHADGKLGKVAQPLRIAVSGSTVSPAIHETLAILGQSSVVRRARRCLAWWESARADVEARS